jgi:MFS family permease
MMEAELRRNLRYNFIVNILDGGFFGLALGFASFVTIIPLFVSTLTDSAILIGLIPAIHTVGWQFPQLLIANHVAKQRRYKPMVVFLTMHERLPFLFFILVAFITPRLGSTTALVLTFLLLIWQGLGAGFTAIAWQSMIAKVFPGNMRGTLYGTQSSAANLLSSGGAIAAGLILARLGSPHDFALCFALASLGMAVSWYLLAQTREPDSPPAASPMDRGDFWKQVGGILRRDTNFRWFLVARILSQAAIMAFAFYTVYAVRQLGMSEVTVGVLTSVYLGAQIIANPIMGWLSDRWSHRAIMGVGLLSAAASGLFAWLAPNPAWFYGVYMLAGVANAAVWTVGLAMILEFGREADRPTYIGLANTLVAPSAILAPLLGGWLADLAGYPAAFIASAIAAILTVLVIFLLVRDPKTMALPVSDAGVEIHG